VLSRTTTFLLLVEELIKRILLTLSNAMTSVRMFGKKLSPLDKGNQKVDP